MGIASMTLPVQSEKFFKLPFKFGRQFEDFSFCSPNNPHTFHRRTTARKAQWPGRIGDSEPCHSRFADAFRLRGEFG
jgi:hypothetical protein